MPPDDHARPARVRGTDAHPWLRAMLIVVALVVSLGIATPGVGAAVVPRVTSVAPASGPPSGGSVVTLRGSGFGSVKRVLFGVTPATSVKVVSTSTIEVVTPARAAGVVHVRVVTGAGTSAQTLADRYTYVAAPAVTGLSPKGGGTGGGTSVRISGARFVGVRAVSFGSVPATSFTVSSATALTAIAPPNTPGPVDVRVTAHSGTSPVVAADVFSYRGLPVVTGVSPAGGSSLGGTEVTITGTGLAGATAVTFGGVEATWTAVSGTSIQAIAPPATHGGSVDVQVTTGAGTSAANDPAAQFTYEWVGPTVTAVTPAEGPLAGATPVTLIGSGFTEASAVHFGDLTAPGFTVVSDTEISTTSPEAGWPRQVPVRVTTPTGQSPLAPEAVFSYHGTGPGGVANGPLIAYTRGVDTDADGIFLGGSAEELGTDVFIQNVSDGSAPVLVNQPNNRADITPSFSPDGTKVAWSSNATPSGTFDILVKDLTTGLISNLSNTGAEAYERWPNWSADGSRIVYSKRTGRDNLDIWMMNADGSDQHYVAGKLGPGSEAEDCCVSFDATGDGVVFASNRAGNFDVYHYRLGARATSENPAQLTRLTRGSLYEGTPSVETSGTVIYRLGGREQQMYRLDPARPTMAGVAVPTPGQIRTPAGTPDGFGLIFGWRPDATAQLDIAHTAPDGTGLVKLTNTPTLSETDPAWQPLPAAGR